MEAQNLLPAQGTLVTPLMLTLKIFNNLKLVFTLHAPLFSIKITLTAERLMRVGEDWSSNPGLVKSVTALQTVRHQFNVYANSCATLALSRGADPTKNDRGLAAFAKEWPK